MAIDQTLDLEFNVAGRGEEPSTIICSRDKDLRQVPGWQYSWELGKQPEFGPEMIDKLGYLKFDNQKKKLTGTGLSFFFAQCLMGDSTDNIPGLPGCGPVAAYDDLRINDGAQDMLDVVQHMYCSHYGSYVDGDRELLEQGRLLWMVRRMNDDGSPQLWELGMEE